MDTKMENGRLTEKIPNTNLIRVLEGGIETITCTSEEGLTRKDILGYEEWLKTQPGLCTTDRPRGLIKSLAKRR